MKRIILLLSIIILTLSVKSQQQTNYIFTATGSAAFTWYPPTTIADNLGTMQLIASKTGVAGNALASTALDFVSGISLGTHTPLIAIVKFSSGTLGISVARIKTDAGYLVAATPLATLTSADNNYPVQLLGAVRNTGNVSIEVTTAGLSASAIAVYVYGIKKQ